MATLHVAVLIAEKAQHGVGAIVDAHRNLGHCVEVVHLGAVLTTTDGVRFPGCTPDVCHSRASAMWGLDVQKQIEQHIPILNTVAGQRAGRDKWVCAKKLVAHQVPTPPTMLLTPKTPAVSVVSALGDDVVVKPRTGHSGVGVQRLVGMHAVEQFLATADLADTMVAQPYVPSAAGKDLRVMVVGGEALYVLERRSVSAGEFRTNTGLGGTIQVGELSDKVAAVSCAAAAACGLDVAGVDVCDDGTNPVVIEVNTNAGVGSAIHLSTGVDVAYEAAKLVVQRAEQYWS